MSRQIYHRILEQILKVGVKEFCLCPGSRNSPLVHSLIASPALTKYNWYEERSAAFFALGRARQSGRPVAIVTTSGTAAGELFPAAMEAHYTGTPLLLITADRPKRFRGTGAPQTAEQQGLFGIYAHFSADLEGDDICHLDHWDFSGPAHLNICLEEPKSYPAEVKDLSPFVAEAFNVSRFHQEGNTHQLDHFFQQSHAPFVIVGALPKKDREAVGEFLLRFNAPVYCESGSGLREDPRLKHLQIRVESAVWVLSKQNHYAIDGVLRIGGVPVTRLWRDLEERQGVLVECSLSNVPFSGLSWGSHLQCDITAFLSTFDVPSGWKCCDFSGWLSEDGKRLKQIRDLFVQFPASEPALFEGVSGQIPERSLVYLGNSSPVREWDLAASLVPKELDVEMSRGLNGIDGQLSTFLGLCAENRENWAIVGDLTALYDFPALWILQALPVMPIKIIVVNNGGGKIFARIYKDPIFQHLHHFNFEHFAKSWKIPYFCFNGTMICEHLPKQAFVEICPDPLATEAFWEAYDALQ